MAQTPPFSTNLFFLSALSLCLHFHRNHISPPPLSLSQIFFHIHMPCSYLSIHTAQGRNPRACPPHTTRHRDNRCVFVSGAPLWLTDCKHKDMYLGQAFAAGSDCVLLAGVVSEFDSSEIGTGRAVPAIQRANSSQHNTHSTLRAPWHWGQEQSNMPVYVNQCRGERLEQTRRDGTR